MFSTTHNSIIEPNVTVDFECVQVYVSGVCFPELVLHGYHNDSERVEHKGEQTQSGYLDCAHLSLVADDPRLTLDYMFLL